MSTRGAVAWGNLNHWKGVYNHYDSYPSGLGKAVWDKIKEVGARPLVDRLVKAYTWDDAMRDGVCPYCGQKAHPDTSSMLLSGFYNVLDYHKKGIEGLPAWQREGFLLRTSPEKWVARQRSIRGDLWDKSEIRAGFYGTYDAGYKSETDAGLEIAKNFQRTGYPDPDMKHHGHIESSLDPMNEVTSDKLFIEWVYIIDLEADALHVLNFGQVGCVRAGLRRIGLKRALRSPGDEGTAYAHWHVASVSLSEKDLPPIRPAREDDEQE